MFNTHVHLALSTVPIPPPTGGTALPGHFPKLLHPKFPSYPVRYLHPVHTAYCK